MARDHIFSIAAGSSGLGEVYLPTGTPVRTRYRGQVARLAPPELEGRDAEMAELAEFCVSPATAGTYTWWQAGAWSGKSALMSWFVLNPPPGVRVVSFFITARWVAQDNRAAFVDNLLEQLLSLLGAGLPPLLTESTREGHLLELLGEAAEACRARGEPFVLVVDGLDEDRGVYDGPDSHSIAALLPAEPPAGMRVILAGRPNPPIPPDVPTHHPLRDAGIVRALAPSPRAQTVRADMERDLSRLLEGSVVEQDLLGLVAAAGGGLSAEDLVELTGTSTWQVDKHLRGVTGRSFSVRNSQLDHDGPAVYLLGHEELQTTAVEMLGPRRLAGYRARLHTWAELYRERGWPTGTPEYLLHGYFGMLTKSGEVDRMVACASDPDRQDRVLERAGGDVIGLSEVIATMDTLAAEDDPDLIAMVRLAVHRDHLTARNEKIPAALLGVLAKVGQFPRAEATANSITQPERRCSALAELAMAALSIGDRDRAIILADRAEQAMHAIDSIFSKELGMETMARTFAAVGDFDRAEAIVGLLRRPDSRADLLATLIPASVAAGDRDRVSALADRAEREACASITSEQRALELTILAKTVAAAGDLDRAFRLIDRAEQEAAELGDDDLVQVQRLAELAEAAAAAGDPIRASDLANRAIRATAATKGWRRPYALTAVAKAIFVLGDREGAEELIAESDERASGLLELAEAAVAAGDLDHATVLAHRANQLSRTDAEIPTRASALAVLATVAGALGDIPRADAVLDAATDLEHLRYMLVELAEAAVAAGDLDRATVLAHRAEHAARSVDDNRRQAKMYSALAEAVVATGDLDHATVLAHRAARSIDPVDQGPEMKAVVKAFAVVGDLDHAEALAGSRHWPFDLVKVIAEAAAAAGELDRAARLADVEDNYLHHVFFHEHAVAAVAGALAAAGDLRRAQALASRLTKPDPLACALAALAKAAVAEGDLDRAIALADQAEQSAHAISDSIRRLEASVAVVAAFVATGDLRRASVLANRAELAARATDPFSHEGRELSAAAKALAAAGDLDRAEQIAHTIPHRSTRASTLLEVTRTGSRARRARAVAESLRLADWFGALRDLTELTPTAPVEVLRELATVSRSETM